MKRAARQAGLKKKYGHLPLCESEETKTERDRKHSANETAQNNDSNSNNKDQLRSTLSLVLDDHYRAVFAMESLTEAEQRLAQFKQTLVQNADWDAILKLASELAQCIDPVKNQPLRIELPSIKHSRQE